MTFKPSDDVLDQLSESKNLSLLQGDFGSQNEEDNIFGNNENVEDTGLSANNIISSAMMISSNEVVKAPDLSELLKNAGDGRVGDENEKKVISNESLKETINLDDISSQELDKQLLKKTIGDEGINQNSNENNKGNMNQKVEESLQKNELDYIDPGKMLDSERHTIVSSIVGSVSSNLDFFADNFWIKIIKKYKNLHRLLFRWGFVVCISTIGIVFGMLLQVNVGTMKNMDMVNDSLIGNKNMWVEETPDKILQQFVDKQFDVSIPYGSVNIDGSLISSKSNLILYGGVVLPQLFSLDSDEFILLDRFNGENFSRVDIEELIKVLITKNSIYRKTANIHNASSLRWSGNKFGGSLKDGFNLSCLGSKRVSDFVCDKFLETFFKYGKYYDLKGYDSELLNIVIDLKNQRKTIEPVCDMVKEYTLHSGITSDILTSIMDYCGEDEIKYYRKLVNFINLENSLGQPTLSSKVFDDPDLNEYKLLSSQQIVYRILDGTSLNEGYISSYLDFVQSLIDKDGGSNRYLHSIYKDILYVFNMDELYQKLMQKGGLSSDLKSKIDQINYGNNFGSASLLSQLTTSDIVQSMPNFEDIVPNQRTLEEIFSQYYAMTDRLKIREAKIISDEEIKVKTEMFTDKIMRVTNGQTLKVTAVLRKRDNVLYVDSIKIANQPKFTDILGIYSREGNITFYAMLNYIDEQVGMWYDVPSDDLEEQPDFCDEIMKIENIDVYTCDDSLVSLYKGEIGYEFVLEDGVLASFAITDENIDVIIKNKLDGVLFMKESTPGMIMSIIDFDIESEEKDNNLEKKIEIIDQFRIHFKTVPNYVYEIEGKLDVFLVDFKLGDFSLQGYYDVNTHELTKISFMDCPKPLEIKQLSLEITVENEPKLLEILNNPRVFFASVNPLIYSKYKNVCGGK